ncbi:MAG: hypothetical protein GEU96_21400 [Propionibacteriales bacterium]|nr:hypothetical protein [Propionibacteriales bacterium]
MTELVLAIVGVTGTLTAGILGSLLHRQTQERVERLQHHRRRTDQKAAALAQFAQGIIEYRRSQLVVWYQVVDESNKGNVINADTAPSSVEMRRARSESWASYYSVRLLWGEHEIISSAAALLNKCSGLQRATHEEQLGTESDVIIGDLNAMTDRGRQLLA